MKRILYDQYSKLTLPEFVEKMQEECYDPIERLCESARKQAGVLVGLELHQSASQYISLCNKVIGEILQCLSVRKEQYIPYIIELSMKTEAKHDCTNCTGNCKLNHDMTILEMQASLNNIKSILYRLQMVSLPLYSETIYPDTYRVLRNMMALIENNLTEMYALEESYFIPKVTEAQKSINAGS